jgi:hypothetical protein
MGKIIRNISTASILFKNTIFSFPNWFVKINNADYGLIVLLAEKGKGKYLPDVMSVYRVHDGGVWSSQNNEYVHKQDLIFYNYLLEYLKEKKIKRAIQQKINFVKANHGIHLLRNAHFLKGFSIIVFYNNWFSNDLRIPLRKIMSGMKKGLYKFFDVKA